MSLGLNLTYRNITEELVCAKIRPSPCCPEPPQRQKAKSNSVHFLRQRQKKRHAAGTDQKKKKNISASPGFEPGSFECWSGTIIIQTIRIARTPVRDNTHDIIIELRGRNGNRNCVRILSFYQADVVLAL